MNMFEWCNEGITPEIQNLQYLDYETGLGLDWMDNYNEEGLFFCPDIRTPMNAIVGLTALSLDEQDLSPRVRENLINIRGSSDFLLGLVNDTLDMSKIESGAVTLKLEPYYYTDFLAKMKAMFEPQCNAKNIDFTFEDGGARFQWKTKRMSVQKITIHLSFTLCKMEETHQPSRALHEAGNAANLKGKHILLVEDHPLNAQIARKLPEKKGMTVFHAENGKVGVDSFETSQPSHFDAILMDIRMPVMDGLEAARAIRSSNHPDAKTILIIALSANAYDEDVKKSIDAGMNGHLAKPVKPEKLYATLEKFLAELVPR